MLRYVIFYSEQVCLMAVIVSYFLSTRSLHGTLKNYGDLDVSTSKCCIRSRERLTKC